MTPDQVIALLQLLADLRLQIGALLAENQALKEAAKQEPAEQ